MLVIWLFGIAAGVANACIAAGPQAHASASVDASVPAQPGEAMSIAASGHHAAPGAASGHGDASDDGAAVNANCQDFCDRSSISVPTVLKSPFDAACSPCAPPPRGDVLALMEWVPPVVSLAQPLRRAGPSITIAYLRLAL
jgi:hypothetical protein